ncbi:carbohydrate kinase family protein [Dermabacter vaginalis]|uniref:Carbohydrate kinase family protein n=2 Tax=Dermabacter vaginalis TaxID=1630135 RepID=A0ABX6A3N0_9MICO|nr:carbohydrate kinase family protein [Dermabacter vaginalis]
MMNLNQGPTCTDAATSTISPRDLACVGPVFLDVLFTPFAQLPRLGEECHTESVALAVGGAANVARAAAALGIDVTLATELGDGPITQLVKPMLEADGVGLGASVTLEGWDVPCTAAIPHEGDRMFYTGGLPSAPLATTKRVLSEQARHLTVSLEREDMPLLAGERERGTRIWADVGHDDSGAWDPAILRHLEHCYAFCPNDEEATRYTRTNGALDAARVLAERVELVVVSRGREGLVAIDSGRGEVLERPGFIVERANATGAGDTLVAALVTAIAAGRALGDALDFAQLVAAARVAGAAAQGMPPGREALSAFASQYGEKEQELVEETLDQLSSR